MTLSQSIARFVHTLDIDRPLLCLALFKSNRDTGALIAAALILGSAAGF